MYCTSSSTSVIVRKTVTRLKERHEIRSIEVLTNALMVWKCCTFSATNPLASLSKDSSNSPSGRVASCEERVAEPEANLPGEFDESTTALACGLELLELMMPPKKKDMPSTRSMLDSTDPSNVAFTTSKRPARKVCIMMTISTALPKVAFKRPASMSFLRPAASSSVASPRIFARGTIAKKHSQNVTTFPHSRKWDATPKGANTISVFNGWFSSERRPFPSTFDGLGIEEPFTNLEVDPRFGVLSPSTSCVVEPLILMTHNQAGCPWTTCRAKCARLWTRTAPKDCRRIGL
mmetsp:Transcript_47744/g.87463  ORF Transcript_47744/g.87463 Transcript_47744/m.87463 type:complete len:291 (-) Transcript_47744:15-887(-)